MSPLSQYGIPFIVYSCVIIHLFVAVVPEVMAPSLELTDGQKSFQRAS